MLKRLRKYLDRTKVIREVGSFDGEGLICAVEERNLICLEILLDAGIDVNSKSERGIPAISRAIDKEHLPCLRLLVESNVDLDQKSVHGLTPLMHAIDCGNKHIFAYLLGLGPELELTDPRGETALFHAIRSGNTTFSRKLMEAGANCEHQNEEGISPLMLATDHERIGIVKALLNEGVDPNVKDHHGHSALDRHQLSPRITKLLNKAAAPSSGATTSYSSSHSDSKGIISSILFPQIPQVGNLTLGLVEGILQTLGSKENVEEFRQVEHQIRELLSQYGANHVKQISLLPKGIQARLEKLLSVLIILAQPAQQPPSTPNESEATNEAEVHQKGTEEINQALIEAVSLGSESLVKLCLNQGADPNTKTKDGQPVLQLALSNSVIMEQLIEAGAEAHLAEYNGISPNGHASSKDENEELDLLPSNHASDTPKD